MKFKFHYESLLDHRRLEEQVARRDFLEAQQKFDEQKNTLDQFRGTLVAAEDESCEIKSLREGLSLSRLLQLDTFIVGQKIKIQRQIEIVKNFEKIMEGKQDILVAAAKETKILEKLKEKQRLAFKKALSKKELKATDEVVVTRFKMGGSGRL